MLIQKLRLKELKEKDLKKMNVEQPIFLLCDSKLKKSDINKILKMQMLYKAKLFLVFSDIDTIEEGKSAIFYANSLGLPVGIVLKDKNFFKVLFEWYLSLPELRIYVEPFHTLLMYFLIQKIQTDKDIPETELYKECFNSNYIQKEFLSIIEESFNSDNKINALISQLSQNISQILKDSDLLKNETIS